MIPVRPLLALVLMTTLLTPTIGAHTPNPNANCDVALEAEEAEVQVDLPEGVATLYILTPVDDLPQLWLESNEYAGLQTHEHTCRMSPEDPGTSVEADTRIL